MIPVSFTKGIKDINKNSTILFGAVRVSPDNSKNCLGICYNLSFECQYHVSYKNFQNVNHMSQSYLICLRPNRVPSFASLAMRSSNTWNERHIYGDARTDEPAVDIMVYVQCVHEQSTIRQNKWRESIKTAGQMDSGRPEHIGFWVTWQVGQ